MWFLNQMRFVLIRLLGGGDMAARMHEADIRLRAAIENVEQYRGMVKRLRDDFESRIAQLDNEYNVAQRTIRAFEAALETEREKVKVHETTIQTLVAANRLHLERLDAETKIQVRRGELAVIKE